MNEYKFVSKFVDSYKRYYKLEAIQASGKNQSSYADCEIYYNGSIIKLEAKKLMDTRTNSVHFYNLLGEVIGTLSKPSLLQQNSLLQQKIKNAFITVGILIPHQCKSVFDSLWSKKIAKKYGNLLCFSFGVSNLFTYDVSNKAIRKYIYDFSNNNWTQIAIASCNSFQNSNK